MWGQARIVLSVLLALAGGLLSPADAMPGAITIAGNGPELRVVEQLAHAFERNHVGAVIEVRWDPSLHPVDMVKSGEADFAVAGQTDADLLAIPIAWDGIALVVDFTNPVKEVTSQQVAAIFSGAVTRWSALGGTDTQIVLIDRPPNQHIRGTFESVMGIVGHIPATAQVRRSDQRAISSVAGNASAVTYASLGVALDAVTYGVGVALLTIDGVEPAKETVKDGRYRLRRRRRAGNSGAVRGTRRCRASKRLELGMGPGVVGAEKQALPDGCAFESGSGDLRRLLHQRFSGNPGSAAQSHASPAHCD
jgi:phosphate transport system substrate-binding protein